MSHVSYKPKIGDRSINDVEISIQAEALAKLQSLPSNLAIAVCLSYLLYHSENHHEVFRKLLNEKVVRNGFQGESMINVLNRGAK